MNKIASIFLLVPLTISLIIISALLEDYCFRGAGCVVGLSFFFVALAIGSDSNKFREWLGFYFFITGPILAGVFYFLSLFLKVHVDTTESTVRIISPFYTRVVAEGTRLERKNIAYAFKIVGFKEGVERDDFWFLYTDHGTCIVCDQFTMQVELDTPVSIVEKVFEDGTLQFVQDGHGNVFDLHGHPVRGEDYKPIRNDYTINDGPLN